MGGPAGRPPGDAIGENPELLTSLAEALAETIEHNTCYYYEEKIRIWNNMPG